MILLGQRQFVPRLCYGSHIEPQSVAFDWFTITHKRHSLKMVGSNYDNLDCLLFHFPTYLWAPKDNVMPSRGKTKYFCSSRLYQSKHNRFILQWTTILWQSWKELKHFLNPQNRITVTVTVTEHNTWKIMFEIWSFKESFCDQSYKALYDCNLRL